MSHTFTSQASFATQLPPDTYHYLIRTLRLALPAPPTDSPEDLAHQDNAVIARIAALCPAEADVAALSVAASEQWKECLRLAEQSDPTSYWAQKCRAQANSMMRQSQSAIRLLLRMQAARQKTEANTEARDRAAWTEHCAINLMTEALSPPPAPPPPPPTPEPPADTPSPCGRIEPRSGSMGERAAPMTHHTAHPATPERAAVIRVWERLTDPPGDEGDLVQSLINALTTPQLAT